MNAIMAQVLVRRLDPLVVERLRVRAKAHGRSLEEELRVILTATATSPHADFIAWLEGHSMSAKRRFDVVRTIREARDSH